MCAVIEEKVMTQIADAMADTGWRSCSWMGGSRERTEGNGTGDEEAEQLHSSHANSWQLRQEEALIWKEEEETHRGGECEQ